MSDTKQTPSLILVNSSESYKEDLLEIKFSLIIIASMLYVLLRKV